jgi:hypothetical protein
MLTATPAGGATFNGWGGACSGNGSCLLTMNSIESVTAMFSSSGGGGGPSSQTFVSATLGSDSNPCTRMSPCLTFAAALAQTTAGGEIDVLDPGDFGPVTITKAITLDGGGGQTASVMVSGTNGIDVSAGANDVVILRNLRINGIVGSGNGGLNGIRFNSGHALIVDHVDVFDFVNNGIAIVPSTASKVTLADCHIANTATAAGNAAVLIAPTANASVTLNRVYMEDNLNGVFANGGANIIHLNVRDSVITRSNNNGIALAGTSASVTADVVNTMITYSVGIGASVTGSSASLKLGDDAITNNVTGVSSAAGGTLLSFKNNQIIDNGTDGTPIAAVPGYSGPLQ